MLDHLRHRGESATKTVKFFAAHTVNCVICNDHTIIDWMLLKFTQVIQQNCRQPGRKFEKSFCAVDRLSCQLELSKSETSQFRSDLVFDIVNYVHVIFLHGGLMLFWDIWRVQTSVLLNFYARIVPMLATSFQWITRLPGNLGYLTSSDFCVAKILWASNVPESSRCWQHHSN